MADQEFSNFPKIPTKVIDLTGQRFGRFTVVAFGGIYRSAATWYCRCECGRYRAVRCDHLRQGRTTSCGCFQREETSVRSRTHGKRRSAEYRCWSHVWHRCTNPADRAYRHYGGRGITVCERWRSFEKFFSDMGPRPTPKHSIERLDNEKGYCPENCKWATDKEQCRNRRNNRLITHQGRTQCLSAWAEELGINKTTISQRLKTGWPVERALTLPLQNALRFEAAQW